MGNDELSPTPGSSTTRGVSLWTGRSPTHKNPKHPARNPGVFAAGIRIFVAMDPHMEIRWRSMLARLERQFGGGMDLESLLFLIGVQELGKGPRRFKKDEKLDLMHIGICAVLEPLGYYRFSHRDDDGWVHYDAVKKLPFLTDAEQKILMRRAVMEYFEREEIIPGRKSFD